MIDQGQTRPPALSPSASLRLPLIENWLTRIAPSSVLEAGCGMGAMAWRFASRFDYRGYEPDPTSYGEAAARLARLGKGDVRNEPVPDEPDRSFDLLVAFEVLEHIEDDQATLRSWVRWLNPGGHVLISVPAHPDRFGPCDEMAGHCRRYERDSLATLLRSAGLEPLSIESWGMPLGYLLEAGRNLLARRRLDKEVGTRREREILPATGRPGANSGVGAPSRRHSPRGPSTTPRWASDMLRSAVWQTTEPRVNESPLDRHLRS